MTSSIGRSLDDGFDVFPSALGDLLDWGELPGRICSEDIFDQLFHIVEDMLYACFSLIGVCLGGIANDSLG